MADSHEFCIRNKSTTFVTTLTVQQYSILQEVTSEILKMDSIDTKYRLPGECARDAGSLVISKMAAKEPIMIAWWTNL